MEGKRFKCDVCDKRFVTSTTLLRHQMIHTGEKPFKCDVCDKSFSGSSDLCRHRRIHTGEKPFTCELCDKSFSMSSGLHSHRRTHTGEKPFSCEFCNKSFSQLSSLHSHQRIHTGKKPFLCELCDKSFSQLSSLQSHQRIHTGEKPFPCEVCDKSFSQLSHLHSHRRIHTGEKPFSCEVCDKSFSQLSHLHTHRRLHTGEKPFTCETCDKSFSNSSTLRKHQHVHTGKKPLPRKVKLAHNTQERSLTRGQVLYIKELTEQEEFTRKLFSLCNPTITNDGSDMGMSEDTQVSMDTSDSDGGKLAASSEIPERADEEGTELKTSQQCGIVAAVEEGEECQEDKLSDLEDNVDELKLNTVACMREEACDVLATVAEGGRPEPSISEERAALGTEPPPFPQVHGQHQAHDAGEVSEDDLKPLACLHQEQVQSTESYQATSNLLQQTMTQFKRDVRHNLQRNNEILQQHLQRNNEILQQQNEVLCQLLQRSNETLNEMRQILSQTVAPAPSGQQQPNTETSAAGHIAYMGEVLLQGQGRHRRN